MVWQAMALVTNTFIAQQFSDLIMLKIFVKSYSFVHTLSIHTVEILFLVYIYELLNKEQEIVRLLKELRERNKILEFVF